MGNAATLRVGYDTFPLLHNDFPTRRPSGRTVVDVLILCVDGPLAGAQTTVEDGAKEFVLHAPDGTEVRYRIDGLLSEFPGSLYAAKVVTA